MNCRDESAAAGLFQIREADRDDEKCFEPLAERYDKCLQHGTKILDVETDRVFKRIPPYTTSQVGYERRMMARAQHCTLHPAPARAPSFKRPGAKMKAPMFKKFAITLALTLPMTIAASQSTDSALLGRARALHKQTPLIDGHNDYPWALRENAQRDLDKLDVTRSQPAIMTDIPRLRSGGVGGQFWSVYVPADLAGQAAVTATLEQIDIVHRMMRKYPDTFELAFTADDVERVFRTGKIASLIGMEGGHSIDSSLGALRMFYQLGARYMTLTHARNVPWADSCSDEPVLGGLSPFGEQVVREMNWLGMLVDLSHTSPDTMADAIRVSEAPVIFSHSAAKALNGVPRNVPDDVLRMLPKNGGVVMVTFVPGFLSPKVAEWNKRQTEETARLQQQFPGDEAARKAGLDAWTQSNPVPR